MTAIRPGLVVPAWPPERVANGIVTAAAAALRGYREHGVDPVLLTGRCEGGAAGVVDWSRIRVGRCEERVRGVLSRFVGGRARHGLICEQIRRAVDAAAGGGVDVVEIEESWGLGQRALDRCVVPVVVRLHGPWFLNGPAVGVAEDGEYRRRVRLEGRLIGRARWVTAPSLDVIERTRAFYGLDLEGARVIPNAALPADASSHWRDAAAEPGLVVMVGRFDRHKGGDVMVDAFVRVAASRPEARLVLVGPDLGVRGSGGRVARFREYVDAAVPGFLRDRVESVGSLPHRELDALRRRAAVVVVASRYENFPNTVLEAMAVGAPVVATRVGGVPEMLEDGVSGLLAEGGDADDLAVRVDRLLGDRVLAAGLGARARARVIERYAPGVVAGEALSFFGDVVSGWGGRGAFRSASRMGGREG